MHVSLTQVHDARRLSKQRLHDGVIRGGHSRVAGYRDFGLCAQNNRSLTYRPTTVGYYRTRVLAVPFLSPQRRTGWIRQD